MAQGEANLWILYGGEMRFSPQFSWSPYATQTHFNVFDKFTVSTCDSRLLFHAVRSNNIGGRAIILDSNNVQSSQYILATDRLFPIKQHNNLYQIAMESTNPSLWILRTPALFLLNPGIANSMVQQDSMYYTQTEGYTVTKKDSLYGYWFIYYSAGNNRIVALPFNSQGFDSAGSVHTSVPPIPWYNQPNRIEVSPNGKIVAMADYNANVLHLWQFKPQTGEWSNRLSISAFSIGPFNLQSRMLSLCFSEHSTKLYVKSSGDQIQGMYQLDLTTWDSIHIQNSAHYISVPGRSFSWPALAPDGNIYFNSYDNRPIDSLFYGRLLYSDSTFVPQNLEVNIAGFKTYNGRVGYADGSINRFPWINPHYLNPNRYSIVAQNQCFGDSTRLSLYDYQNLDTVVWDFGDGSPRTNNFAPAHLYPAPGLYVVTAFTRYCNRPDTLYYQLEILGNPELPFADSSICRGDSLRLQLPANWQYVWSTGDSTATVSFGAAGTYSVTINNGCFTATDSFELHIVDPATTTLPVDTGFCMGDSVWIDPGPLAGSVLWSDGGRDARWISQAGNYTLSMTNACGTENQSISIGVYGAPPLTLHDTSLCEGRVLRIELPEYWETNYLWQDGNTERIRSLNDSGLYIVNANNPCGSNTDSLLLELRDCNCTLYLPNAFSPNGDGINDQFNIISRCPLSEFELLIYDRWGKNIFRSTTISQGWDGRFNGELLPVGAYAYVIRYMPEGSGWKVDKGVVHLVR